jgi:dTDP-4-amino-4,6-dideoxygalactose transaminase/CelD/BcsL family acetyltransferase involved in cellulose biosynthesis
LLTIGRISVAAPPTPSAYCRRATQDLPFPLQSPDCELFVRGRHALYAGVLASGLEPGDQVLVPAYHHGAEIEALRRAGVECLFYGATPDLEPDPQELSTLMGPRCRALLLIHVLGFPRDVATWRRWCDERGLLLIEDAAQAWSAMVDGQPVGSHGDLSIFSPYKTLPLPYISAAVSRRAIHHTIDPRDGHLNYSLVPLHHAWGAKERAFLQRLTDGCFSTTAAERDFALGNPTMRPGLGASILLYRLAGEDAARARRENYRLILEQLAHLVPTPFDQLPEGASPIALPVEVPDKKALMERLSSSGVGCVDFWATPHPSVPPDCAATAAHRRRSTVALPVHQGLTVDDLDRIAKAVHPPSRRQESLYVEHVDNLDVLRSEWTALAPRTLNVFASWEWHRTWWAHFGGGRRLVVTALRDASGALRAVLPLYLWAERPLRIARFVGHGAGDQLGPICAFGDEPAVSRAIRGLARNAGWELMLGEQLPARSAWGKRLSGRTVSREGNPIVLFNGSWDETTRTWSRRLRKELRRDERRLRDDHDVYIRTVSQKGDLETGLDTLFRLHRARWPQGTRFAQRENFHRDFARCAFDNGWMRLRILEVDGQPAAARLGFRFHGVESGYQSGWDPEYAAYSIGIQLVANTIRSAHADGMLEYRFLRGGESYKYRFANADPGLETVLFSRASVPGLAAAGAALARTRVRGYVRSMTDRSMTDNNA